MKKLLLLLCAVGSAFGAWADARAPQLLNAPEGTLYEQVYGCSQKTYLLTQGGFGSFTNNCGYCTQIVVNDKDIYLHNIIREYAGLNSWVKGTLTDDGKAVFQFPQEVGEDVNGKKLLVAMVTPSQEATGTNLVEDTENPNLTCSWDGKTLTQLFNNEADASLTSYNGMIGLFDSEGAFREYGEKGVSYTIWDQAPLSAPENLTTEKLTAEYTDQWNDKYKLSVNLGIDGNNAWIQGLCTFMPEQWIKGTVDADGNITLSSDQFIGVTNDYFLFFYAAQNGSYQAGKEYAWAESVKLEATETGYQASSPMMINLGNTRPWFGAGIANLTLRRKTSADMTPVAPVFGEPEWDENEFMGCADVYIAAEDVSGDALDTENLYYRVYFDGELIALASTEAGEPIYDLKYGQEYDFVLFMYDWHFIIFFEQLKSIGVQSVYKVGDQEYVSEISTYVFGEGVSDAIGAEKEIKNVKYYNLSGAEITEPVGLHIRKVTFTDGSMKVTKEVK